jgi:hypothetical protein
MKEKARETWRRIRLEFVVEVTHALFSHFRLVCQISKQLST